jgi:hypothetical protein
LGEVRTYKIVVIRKRVTLTGPLKQRKGTKVVYPRNPDKKSTKRNNKGDRTESNKEPKRVTRNPRE